MMNIHLREVEPGDLPLFFAHQQDADAAAMAAFASRDRAAFDQHWAKLLADETNLVRTIVVDPGVSPETASREQVAGNIGSFTRDGEREVGYWIDRAYWGRGVATAALTAYLSLEQTRPLYAGVAKQNAASLRVLEKCGFTFHANDDSHLILVLRNPEPSSE
jgi:RimJ/RimL family protein N-acetyltransferase